MKAEKKKTHLNKKKLNKVKKREKIIACGIIHIKSTFNNTIVTFSDLEGRVISGGQSSAGKIGYKGTKKSTPYAAQLAISKILEIAKACQTKEVHIKIKGIGPGRNSVLRILENSPLDLLSVSDVTPLPHNGCRPPKRPRV